MVEFTRPRRSVNPNMILKRTFEKTVTRVFIDSTILHRLIGCHRMSDRSFFLNNRQFHICARCTGLVTGIPLSLLFIPFSSVVGSLFPICIGALMIDGLTQKVGLRESNNLLRFSTGLVSSATFLPFIFYLHNFL